MIAVLSYFQTKIEEVDATYREWSGKFDLDDIARNNHAKAYHIEFGDMASGPLQDKHTDDYLNVTVRLIYKASRDVQASRAAAYDSANTVRLNCVKFPFLGANIKNVILDSMGVENVDGSDYSTIMRLNFRVRLIFAP